MSIHSISRGFTALRRSCVAMLAACALLAHTGVAWSQPAEFPNRVVRIVPFGAGGGPIDTIARVYAEKLYERWGQRVVVDAKPGAAGTLAADAVAKAQPDGYTMLLTLSLTHINNPILYPSLPYDPVKDFQPLSMIATGGPMLVARLNAPYDTLEEFVEFARKQPKGMTYGTWGTGSTAHLFAELLKRQSGVNLIHVPYKSESQAHNDLFGETLDIAWANPSTARAHTQGGKMKVLGITGSRRVSSMPDVPTFTELGFQGFDIDSWIGAYLPANTPAPIAEEWTSALREITAMPDVAARLSAFGFEPLGSTPEQFMERYRADYPKVADLIEKAGVTAE